MQRTIGVLALQGDFARHAAMLQSLKVETVHVKKPEELQVCDGLIIPGGESTTLTKLMHKYGFYESIRDFSQRFPIMGTCAGTIMVASEINDHRVTPLHLIDLSVARNAYGRQIESFITNVDASCLSGSSTFRAIFIRAPQIQHVGPNTEVLMKWQKQPIMVRENNILALTFHPELTDDPRIHQYFLEMK